MEFTELADYPVPDGALEEWFPTSDGPWAEDDRVLSFVHEAHLNRDPAAGTSLSWLGTAFDVHGPLDHDAFRRTLQAFVDRHEVLRTDTHTDDAGGVHRRTTAPGTVDVDRIVFATRTPSNFDRLQRMFDEHASARSWPSYVFATVSRTDRFTVFFAGDHSILDGFSIVLVAHELTELYDSIRAGRTPQLPSVGSYVDFGHRERKSGPAPGAARRALDIWRSALDGSGLPEFPLPLGPRTSSAQASISRWLLDADGARAFGEACREVGVTSFAGTMACLGLASYDVLDADSPNRHIFRTVTPVHTRHEPQWEAALGWFVGLAPLQFTVDAESFPATARLAEAAIRRVVPAGEFPFDRIRHLVGAPVEPRFVVSYLDIRSLPGAQTWPERNARALRSRQYTHDVYAWINRTPEGINLSMRFPGNEIAPAGAHRWSDALGVRVAEVARPYRSVGLRP